MNFSAPRLQRSPRAAAVQQNDVLRCPWSSTALVTGGLGGLGLVAAQELLEVGANRRNDSNGVKEVKVKVKLKVKLKLNLKVKLIQMKISL